MNHLKPGHEKILQHITHLTSQLWLKDSQKFWPHFLFHFTDICNVRNILRDGCLFSRNQLEERRQCFKDIASSEIIKNTSPEKKNFVRLYFRPLTPTQYSNEGIRPKNELKYGAHCPVPIFFIFDAKKILILQSTCFTDGNLRSERVQFGDTVDFYLSLPFNFIYHNDSLFRLNDEEKKTIIFHRNSEVLIPEVLDLSNLKYIVCRSQAEFETLMNILPSETRSQWGSKIHIDERLILFWSRWVYVEKVDLDSSSIVFHFNPSALFSPFHAKLEIHEIRSDRKFSWEEEAFKVEKKLEFNLSSLAHPGNYSVSFFLDDHLVYRNVYLDDSGIF